MDLNWARTLFTVCVFISFMLVLIIVWNKRNKANYDDAARSIMDDNDTPQASDAQSHHEHGAK
ncbi:cbb3-type cytochrome oxidase subunit 3 [Neisseriaceae bacterium B1]